MSVTPSTAVPAGYFEAPPPPAGGGACTDPACRCGAPLPAGGFLWVPLEVAACRATRRTWAEAQRGLDAPTQQTRLLAAIEAFETTLENHGADAAAAMAERLSAAAGGDSSALAVDPRHVRPLLLCERAAARRGLDLPTAAADADHWRRTGLAPLRPTPTAEYSAHLRAVRWPAYGLYAVAVIVWVLCLVGAVAMFAGDRGAGACVLLFPVLVGFVFFAAGKCLRHLKLRILVLGACAILTLTQVGIPLMIWVGVVLARKGLWDAFDTTPGVSLDQPLASAPAAAKPFDWSAMN